MKQVKKTALLSLTILLLFFMAACNNSNKQKAGESTTPASSTTAATDTATQVNSTKKLANPNIKIMQWYDPTENQKAMFNNFEEKYGAKIEVVQTTWDEMTTKLVAGVATGDPVDLAYLYGAFFPTNVIKNLFQPIDQYWDQKDPFWDRKKMEYFKWNGKYYGFSSSKSADLDVLFYNKTMFANNGLETPLELEAKGQWNWDSFLKAAKTLTQDLNNDGTPDQFGLSTTGLAWTVFIAANDASFVTTDGQPKPNFDDPKLIESLTFIQKLLHTEKVVGGDFLKGTAGMFATGPWGGQDIVNAGFKDEWDVINVPYGPSNQNKSNAGAWYNSWGIPNGAKNPEGAALLARYMMDPANEVKAAVDSGKKVLTDEQAKRIDAMYANITPSNYSYGAQPNMFWDLAGKIANEGKPVATALEEVRPAWQAEIDKTLQLKGIVLHGKPFVGMKPIDFEDGKVAPIKENPKVLSITDKPEEVLSGKYSIKVKVGPDWYPMMSVDPSYVTIEPGHSYRVTFDYKILEDLGKDGKYFFKFQYGGGNIGWVEFKGAKGESGKVDATIPVYDAVEGLYLDFGAYNGSTVVIDNLNVEAVD